METSKIIEELDNLQEHLEDIKEENYNNVKKIILESQYLQTNDGIESLVHLLNTTARFRPFFIPLLVRLSIELTSSIPEIKSSLFEELNSQQNREVGRHYFLYCLFSKGYFTIDQIISKITHYMSIDNVPEYASLYVWFAPEIKEHNPTLFESITQPSDDYMSPDLEYFWERKDSLFANDFALLKTLRSKGLNDAPYFHCFIEDDPTDLSDVDVETTLPISCYDRFFLLQSSPPLIHLAAYFNASKCFDYLMKKGANLKSTDSYNRTLDLYCIAGSNIEAFSRIEEPNIFKCLLIATSNHRNNMVEMLQSKQSTEDNLTVFGSMLHQSCGTHNIHMTLMCIKNGADINLANSNGETPLHYTANYGHFDLAKLLLAQKDINPNPQNNEGDTPLHLAIASFSTRTALVLLSTKNIDITLRAKFGQTPLHLAAIYGNLNVLNKLLSMDNVDYNVKNVSLRTPLHLALMNRAFDCVKVLLNLKDIQINAQDVIGRTPLHYAVLLKNEEILNLLVAKEGIDVNLKCSRGFTPYEYADLTKYEFGKQLLDPSKWPAPPPENEPENNDENN